MCTGPPPADASGVRKRTPACRDALTAGVASIHDGQERSRRTARSGQPATFRARATPARRPASHASPPAWRRGRAKRADRALHAARPEPRAALSPCLRAARRPRPGRLRGPRQGGRSLGRRARSRLLQLRRPHHPRRAAALLPRRDLGRPARARPAGAVPVGRGGARDAVGRARPLADRRRHRRPARPHARGDRRGPAGDRGPLGPLARRSGTRGGGRVGQRRRPARNHRPRVRARRSRRHDREDDRDPRRPRARDPAPALPGGPAAVRDRRARRLLADARVTDHPQLARAPLRLRQAT